MSEYVKVSCFVRQVQKTEYLVQVRNMVACHLQEEYKK
jgi:hypothetical protein